MPPSSPTQGHLPSVLSSISASCFRFSANICLNSSGVAIPGTSIMPPRKLVLEFTSYTRPIFSARKENGVNGSTVAVLDFAYSDFDAYDTCGALQGPSTGGRRHSITTPRRHTEMVASAAIVGGAQTTSTYAEALDHA